MLRRSLFSLRAKIMSSAEALKDLKDGAIVGFGGFGFCGVPFELMSQLNKNRTKHLHAVTIAVSGEEFGISPLLENGQIDEITTSYLGATKAFHHCLKNGLLKLNLCPQGTFVERVRCGGAGIPGFYTPTGYGTAVSSGELPARFAPDGSGRVAECTPPRETRCIKGRWCTLEESIQTDFSLIKAWKADTKGNLVFRGTACNFNEVMATCAKTCIAEVEEIVEAGELDPNHIHVPSIYVDRIVKPEKTEKRVGMVVVVPKGGLPTEAKLLKENRQRIARRAAYELKDGMYVNLGIGIPTMVPWYLPESVKVEYQAELGMLGLTRYPETEEEVDVDITNASTQPMVIAEKGASMFSGEVSFAMIRGGHIDATMLGALEVSASGDIASWWIPGSDIKGMGGAMDLVSSGCKTIALLEHVDKNGNPRVVEQTRLPLTGKGVADLIITDMAVFEVSGKRGSVRHLVLKEIAEGVTLEELRAKTGAKFVVSDNLETMMQ